jgi:hydrogenase maturation protease
MSERILIIGIGNAYRCDDGAGFAATTELTRIRPAGADIMEAYGDGTSLIDAWHGRKHVILIDATSSGALPGTIHRIEITSEPLPASFSYHSTHSINLAEAVELARVLNRLPERLTVLGIEGQNFRSGTQLSPAVRSAVDEVVRLICEELACVDIEE